VVVPVMSESLMSVFPAEELKRMIMHVDRFDTDVVTDEKLNAIKAEEKVEEITEQILSENL
jgi:hypothetical protein